MKIPDELYWEHDKWKQEIRNSKLKLNKKKAKKVILYLLNKCGAMSEKKLMALLYFCDFDYFEKYECFLCGFTHIKKVETMQ